MTESLPITILEQTYIKRLWKLIPIVCINILIEDRRPDLSNYVTKFKHHIKINGRSFAFRSYNNYSEDIERFLISFSFQKLI